MQTTQTYNILPDTQNAQNFLKFGNAIQTITAAGLNPIKAIQYLNIKIINREIMAKMSSFPVFSVFYSQQQLHKYTWPGFLGLWRKYPIFEETQFLRQC